MRAWPFLLAVMLVLFQQVICLNEKIILCAIVIVKSATCNWTTPSQKMVHFCVVVATIKKGSTAKIL